MADVGPLVEKNGTAKCDLKRGQIVREQDRLLPIANVSRIMKKALPSSAKVSKDARETMQECVSEFISFITSEASDKCLQEKRKTINGDDILWAMATLGFEKYAEPLQRYLEAYKSSVKSEKPTKREKKKNAALKKQPPPAHPVINSPKYLKAHVVPNISMVEK